VQEVGLSGYGVQVTARLNVRPWFVLAILGVVAGSLFVWQLLDGEDMAERAENARIAQIDDFQALRELAIRIQVGRGFLPPQALDMVDLDGTINPDFIGGEGEDDTLRWDLDGDGRREVVTERDVYDESHFADIEVRDAREGVYTLTISTPKRIIQVAVQEVGGKWMRVERVNGRWVLFD
jgi:hypothetical protein